MENKRVSELPQIGEITEGAMFVVEQEGSANHATAKQIGAYMNGIVNKRATKISFVGDVCTITYEGGATAQLTFNRDGNGQIVSVTDSNGHTCTLEGLE